MIIDRQKPHDGSNEYCPDCEEQIDACTCSPTGGGDDDTADFSLWPADLGDAPSREPSALDKYYLSQRPTCEEDLCMEPSVAIIYEQYSQGAQWPKAVCAKHK